MKKKYSLLKTFAITFLIVVLLSWIIPAGTFYYGSYSQDEIDPIGIFELIKMPMSSFGYALQFGFIFLLIGGFYGILNKTGAYQKLVEKIVKKYKKEPAVFATITVLLFAILSSVMGSSTYLFLFVPLFVSILLLLGYNKIGALLATVGSLLVGTIGSTYAFSISGYINYYLNLDTHSNIVVKAILLALTTLLLLFFVLKTHESKVKKEKDEKREEVVIPLYEKEEKNASLTNEKSIVPLIVIFLLGALVILVSTFSWEDVFGITLFKDSYTSLMNAEVLGYPLFKNLLGGFTQIGYWSILDIDMVILIMALLIGWIYSVPFKKMVDSFIDGAKKMLPTFVYATLSTTVLVLLLNANNGNFMSYTIMNFICGLTKEFNVVSYSIASFVNAFFLSHFPYFSGDTLQIAQMLYTDASVYPMIGLITQTVYGISMFVLPTSLLLIAGLSYLQISFKEWIKNAWKLILGLLGIIAVVLAVSTLFL